MTKYILVSSLFKKDESVLDKILYFVFVCRLFIQKKVL